MSSLTPIRRPLLQRLSDLRRGPLQLAVWAAVVLGVLNLMDRRQQAAELVGIARAVNYELVAPVDGALLAVNAPLFQEVRAGQVIALLDGSELEAQLATAEREIERLTAEFEAEKEQRELRARAEEREATSELRRFRTDEEEKLLEILALRVQLEGDRIECDRLAMMSDHSVALVSEGVGAQVDLDNYHLRHQRLVEIIEENENFLAQIEAAHLATQRRCQEFEQRTSCEDREGAVLDPFTCAVDVQRSRLDEIRLRRKRLIVRAPADSIVRAVYRHAGEPVMAGQPLVTLTNTHATEVLAYLSDTGADEIALGSSVELSRPSRATPLARSVALRIGPGVEELPRRLWRQPSISEFGRPVLFAIPEHLDLRPDDLVSIRQVR